MERYCINFVLPWNILFSPSMVIESFAGYSSLGRHLCSLRVYMKSVQDLLAIIVSGEMSDVTLIGLPLYAT
jgi:hypothetical protein